MNLTQSQLADVCTALEAFNQLQSDYGVAVHDARLDIGGNPTVWATVTFDKAKDEHVFVTASK